MSSMSRNNSVNSLMGFSVHQPYPGAPLQFFPAVGTPQLDKMIDAYIPGNRPICDKRAAVTMEFCRYSMATGENYRFFMVYPNLGYSSAFTPSPVTPESQWRSGSSFSPSPRSSAKAMPASDFSNLPGMKIMTKDGRDVTNSASRGCKTKEQRDHAHLMRIIKACDSCRRKKTKCDPSHKRSSGGPTSAKVTKKTKSTRPAAAPRQAVLHRAPAASVSNQLSAEPSVALNSAFTHFPAAAAEPLALDWEQFIQYEDEPADSIPVDYDFFLDPAGHLTPSTAGSFSSFSTSLTQPSITPTDRDVHLIDGTTPGHNHKPILPYLNEGGVQSGDGYLDFTLFSPRSSTLDEEIGFGTELAASPIQPLRDSSLGHSRDHFSHDALANHIGGFANGTVTTSNGNLIGDSLVRGLDNGVYLEAFTPTYPSPSQGVAVNHNSQGTVPAMLQEGPSSDESVPRHSPLSTTRTIEGTSSEGLFRGETMARSSYPVDSGLATTASRRGTLPHGEERVSLAFGPATSSAVSIQSPSSNLHSVTSIASAQEDGPLTGVSQNTQSWPHSTTTAPSIECHVPSAPMPLAAPLPVMAVAQSSSAVPPTSPVENPDNTKTPTGRPHSRSGPESLSATYNVESHLGGSTTNCDMWSNNQQIRSIAGFCADMPQSPSACQPTTATSTAQSSLVVGGLVGDAKQPYALTRLMATTRSLLSVAVSLFVPFVVAMSFLLPAVAGHLHTCEPRVRLSPKNNESSPIERVIRRVKYDYDADDENNNNAVEEKMMKKKKKQTLTTPLLTPRLRCRVSSDKTWARASRSLIQRPVMQLLPLI